MNRKRALRKWILLFFIVCIAQTVDYGTELALAASAQEIPSRIDGYEWRYKIINGKLYKRLYNITKHRWESDWIIV